MDKQTFHLNILELAANILDSFSTASSIESDEIINLFADDFTFLLVEYLDGCDIVPCVEDGKLTFSRSKIINYIISHLNRFLVENNHRFHSLENSTECVKKISHVNALENSKPFGQNFTSIYDKVNDLEKKQNDILSVLSGIVSELNKISKQSKEG